jgi:hypothetical protein
VGEKDREAAPVDATAEASPVAVPARPLAEVVGVTRRAALVRAVATGAPLGNRGLGRALAREPVGDLPIVDPWAGTESQAPAPPTPLPEGVVDPWAEREGAGEAAAPPATASTPAAQLGTYFRDRIVEWLEKFAAAPSVEGAGTGFDELLGTGRGGPEGTRRSFYNYTTCNDTTIQIFAKAAAAVNAKAGYKLPEKPEFKYIGIVRRASDFGAPEIAKKADAWVDADGGRPEKGDLVLFVNTTGGTYPEHIGFYYGHAATKSDAGAAPPPDPDGADVWMTIDGGQGTKGRWDAALKDAVKNPQGYVAGSAKESILKRERWHLKDGRIEGEPNQPGGYKKVLGWVKVDRLIDPARIPAS